MNRREFVKSTAAASAAAAVPGANAAPPSKRPNVLYVFSDQHRAFKGHLGGGSYLGGAASDFGAQAVKKQVKSYPFVQVSLRVGRSQTMRLDRGRGNVSKQIEAPLWRR